MSRSSGCGGRHTTAPSDSASGTMSSDKSRAYSPSAPMPMNCAASALVRAVDGFAAVAEAHEGDIHSVGSADDVHRFRSSGRPLRAAQLPPHARIHPRGALRPRARHRGKHNHLQRRQRRAVAPLAGVPARGSAIPQRGVRTSLQPASRRPLSHVRTTRPAPRCIQWRGGVLRRRRENRERRQRESCRRGTCHDRVLRSARRARRVRTDVCPVR